MEDKKIADTPEEIDALIENLKREVENMEPQIYPEPMAPPWMIAPGHSMTSLNWRMGAGEDYRLAFAKWFRGLPSAKKQEYINLHKEPEGWEGYYSVIELKRTK